MKKEITFEELQKKYADRLVDSDMPLAKEKYKELNFIEADIEKLPTNLNNKIKFNFVIICDTIGYLEDPIGYIPDIEALNEGGYETDRSLKYFGLQHRFSHKIQKKIIECFKSI